MGARILTLDGSPEFMASLAATRKDQKFKLGYKTFYITGGVRLDLSPSDTAPALPAAQIYGILSSNINKIVANAKRQQMEEDLRTTDGE